MIQKQSYLSIADNSGAKEVQCIQVTGSTRKRFAYLGDIVKCSIKKAIPGGSVKKGEMVDVVIVRTRKEFRRADGSYIRFSDNAGVIVKSAVKGERALIGTRIFGPVARELRSRGFIKIVSLAPEVL